MLADQLLTLLLIQKIGEVETKISDVSGLVTIPVLMQKLEKLKVKYQMLVDQLARLLLIQELGKLKKIHHHAKYLSTTEFNKFSSEVFDAKLKQVKLATNKMLNNVPLKIEKTEKMEIYRLSFFIGKSYFNNDELQHV